MSKETVTITKNVHGYLRAMHIMFWITLIALILSGSGQLVSSKRASRPLGAAAQENDPNTVHIGDHFTPYLNFIPEEMILEGETSSCRTANHQSPLVVEKIVDGYARVRYVPRQPYETDNAEIACHPGSTFKVSVEDLLWWRGIEQAAPSKEAAEKLLRKQLMAK